MRAGILRAGLPQLPLTTLNSVISVSQLAGELFPGRGASPAAVSVAVGLMNAGGGWLGAMPCCCGAGGLAAQVTRPVQEPGQRKTLDASMIRGRADGLLSLSLGVDSYVQTHVHLRGHAAWHGAAAGQVNPIVLSARVSTLGLATLPQHEA